MALMQSLKVVIFVVHCEAIRSEQLKTDTFYEPTTYESQAINTSFEEIITHARHEYGQVEVLKIKMRSSVQKLHIALEKCQFLNFPFDCTFFH